jgi:hypothetical protein
VNLNLEPGVVSGYDPPRNKSAALALVREFEVATMVKVPMHQCAGVLIYLLAITGISLLGTKLSSVVAEHVIVLALPHLDNGPSKLSLIERRRIDTTLAIPPLPMRARARVITLEAPSMPAHVLAARLDLAEREDLETASSFRVASSADGSLEPDSHPSSIAARVYETGRTVSPSSRHASVSARDIFNRSFGVLSVASNY